MKSEPQTAMVNPQARLAGFLCENGAHFFYDVSNPSRRNLPPSFTGYAVASLNQVQLPQIAKALLSGAQGVLLAGCNVCHARHGAELERRFTQMIRTLADFGVDEQRLRLEWITAHEEERFLNVIREMTGRLQRLPALRLPSELGKHVRYCG